MKTYWGSGSTSSHPGRFTPGLRAPCTRWIRGWVGPRSSLDAVTKSKNIIIAPCRESIPGRPAHSLVTILTELARCPFAYVQVLETSLSEIWHPPDISVSGFFQSFLMLLHWMTRTTLLINTNTRLTRSLVMLKPRSAMRVHAYVQWPSHQPRGHRFAYPT
jgi:hypothetical protein